MKTIIFVSLLILKGVLSVSDNKAYFTGCNSISFSEETHCSGDPGSWQGISTSGHDLHVYNNRHGKEYVADWWNNLDPTTHSTFHHTADELNFAIIGN